MTVGVVTRRFFFVATLPVSCSSSAGRARAGRVGAAGSATWVVYAAMAGLCAVDCWP